MHKPVLRVRKNKKEKNSFLQTKLKNKYKI